MSNKNLTLFFIALILLGFYYFLRPQVGDSQHDNSLYQEQPIASQSSTTTTTITNTQIYNLKNKTFSISIKDFYFDPQTMVINKGDNIIWINYDPVPHQIYLNGTSSKVLNKGQTFTFTFNQSGTYNYRCSSHASMKGQIIVK